MAVSPPPKKFGCISKLLHWSIFILFCANFFLIYQRKYFANTDPRKLEYILLHKSIGVTAFALGVLFIIWQKSHARPTLPGNMPAFEQGLAKAVHRLLFLLILLMPLTGYLMSVAGGRVTSVFGLFELPLLFAKNEALGQLFFKAHEFSANTVLVVVGLHLLAALYHHFIKRDKVLSRMLPFGNVK